MEDFLDESLDLDQRITNYNKLGMDNLNSGDFTLAISNLSTANQLCSKSNIKLKAMTLNNLGCLYKRLEQPEKALDYLS